MGGRKSCSVGRFWVGVVVVSGNGMGGRCGLVGWLCVSCGGGVAPARVVMASMRMAFMGPVGRRTVASVAAVAIVMRLRRPVCLCDRPMDAALDMWFWVVVCA